MWLKEDNLKADSNFRLDSNSKNLTKQPTSKFRRIRTDKPLRIDLIIKTLHKYFPNWSKFEIQL